TRRANAEPARSSGLRPAYVTVVTAALIAGALTLGPQVVVHGADHAGAAMTGGARGLGFADVVDTVKPAVFAVRVKLAASGPSFDLPSASNQSFREINPSQNAPDSRAAPFVAVAQGSGFFISADGYGV